MLNGQRVAAPHYAAGPSLSMVSAHSTTETGSWTHLALGEGSPREKIAPSILCSLRSQGHGRNQQRLLTAGTGDPTEES